MNAILPITFRDHAAAHGLPIPPELIVDGFAGGGGASEGIEAAFRRMRELGLLGDEHPGVVNIAINHDDAALAMHVANHPQTLHLPHDIWKVNALRVTNGLPVGLMWASPDCRHHSKAKGGRPVSKSVRDLAWVVAYWAKQVRPRVIFLENVEEFRDWGPLMPVGDGTYRPDPRRKGATFDRWIGKFIRMGYRAELRQIRACDFGAPTIRKRLYVILRCDGEPIVWPEATHGDPASAAVRSGRLKPWRVAADIIDWDRPCPSIFMTREEARAYTKATGVRIVRPLARNSRGRIAKGIKRHVLDAAKPFLVTCNHGGEHFRGQGLDEPFVTVTRARDAHGLVMPYLVSRYGERDGQEPRSRAIDEAYPTVVSSGNGGDLVVAGMAPVVTYGQHGGASRPIDDPLHTVEASPKNTDQIAAVFLAQHNGDQRPDGSEGNRAGRGVDLPMATITTRGTQVHEVAAFLAQNNTGEPGNDARRPLSTIVGKGSTQSLVAATLSHAYTSNTNGGEGSPEKPIKTIVAGGNHASLIKLPLLAGYYGTDNGARHDGPLRTATTHDRFAHVEADGAIRPLTETQLARARQVADFLREFGCWDEREFVTVGPYIVVDIGMRMLTARELARAQGLPETYQLAVPYRGGVLSDTQQRHKIGNSVCPDVAEALVFANYRPRYARSEPQRRAA